MVNVTGTTVEFYFFHPLAREVYLAGDFNDWRQDELRMGRLADGCWVASLHLPPGEYAFRYLADGRWFTDYAAFGVRQGPYGVDSVLWVRSQATAARRKGPGLHALFDQRSRPSADGIRRLADPAASRRLNPA